MLAYYNEIDPYAAQWLRNLIAAGHISPGEVDERSILDVRPDDLVGFERCHFFAGVGVWDHALNLAGWPQGRPVWTGSCPCQPFSAAGKRGGTSDERHLWPAFFHLIEQRGPATVFGEQVASKDGLDWLDLVQADLEGAGYDVGAADLCAAGVGAPHIRQRLWFVADAADGGWVGRRGSLARNGGAATRIELERFRDAGVLADADCERREQHARIRQDATGRDATSHFETCGRREAGLGHNGGPLISLWGECDWIPCRDGKARPVEPGTFPLAHGAPARVGRLRAYGNAIVAEAALAFIEVVMQVRP